MAALRGLLMRAMVRGTLNFRLASRQTTRLSSSSPVTAMTASARFIPTWAKVLESQPSPTHTWSAPSSSIRKAARRGFFSMSNTSWPSASKDLVR